MTLRISRTIAPAIATALVATSLVAPASHAADTTPTLQSGQLNWPIKQSFLRYVEGPIASGSITTTDGASYDRKATTLNFPLDVKDSKLDAKGNGTLDFDGALAIKGHHGAMDVTIDDIKLLIDGTTATITADYEAKGAMPGVTPTAPTKGDDAVMATFTLDKAIDPTQPTFKAEKRPTTFGIGAEGAFLNYKRGTTAKDANADLVLDFTPKTQDSQSPSPSSSQTPTPTPTPDKDGSSTLEPGAIAGIVIGILAVLGALGAALTGPFKNLLPF